MGSSRSAAMPAVSTIERCLPAQVPEAGELLHYGMDLVRPDALVVLVSQSGRSVETAAVADRLRAAGHRRTIAVTNDPASPMATLAADVVLPILAGDEATVSTKTWITTFAVLRPAGPGVGRYARGRTGGCGAGAGRGARALLRVVSTAGLAEDAGEAMTGCSALVVVGRGPALSAADYGALILKETAAIAAQCLPAARSVMGRWRSRARASASWYWLPPAERATCASGWPRRPPGWAARHGSSATTPGSATRNGSVAGDDAPRRRRGVRATDHERPHPASRGHPGPGAWSRARRPAAFAEGHRSRVTTTQAACRRDLATRLEWRRNG